MTTRLCTVLAAILMVQFSSAIRASSQEPKSKEEKKEEKKPDAFNVKQLTHGMGLYAIGPVSPDKQSVLLVAQKPDAAPNLYVMNIADHSIRPPLTKLKWGVATPQWSLDSQSIAFAGFNDTATFDEIFVVDIKTNAVRQLTKNAFSDKQPVFTPDGKRVLYTSDESPLPDAAFGILHVASISAAGGKPDFFTEDECSSIHPVIAADGKGVLLVKVSEASGRHSLWLYGLDGKPQRDLTESKFARVRDHIPGAAGGLIVLWPRKRSNSRTASTCWTPGTARRGSCLNPICRSTILRSHRTVNLLRSSDPPASARNSFSMTRRAARSNSSPSNLETRTRRCLSRTRKYCSARIAVRKTSCI